MLKKVLALVFIAGALLALSGCALIQKGLEQVTPELSIGVYKDGLGGVTIGVKLERNNSADVVKPAAWPKDGEDKVPVEGDEAVPIKEDK